MTRRWLWSLGLAGALTASGAQPVVAQDPPPDAAAVADDPLFANLFPPELIMQHRRAIELSDDQRDQISRLIAQLQSQVVNLQWDMTDAVQELARITASPRIDLDRALDQMERVLEVEEEIKQAHLEMLVRIKNLLRPEQQEMLNRLRGIGPRA